MALVLDHVLKDGTTVHIRPIRADDGTRLLDMWARTSAESRRRRFHGSFELVEANVGPFVDLDPDHELALVATRGRGEHERIVGVARYVRDPDERDHAEFAALIQDDHQSRGIGTALVRQVAIAAADAGITHLSGDILADNVRMLNLVRELGLELRAQRDGGGVVRSDLGTGVTTERFLAIVDEDERIAARAALRRFLRPERIAVVGASRDPRAIGGLVFANLLRGGIHGVVYPVNPNASYVQGVAAYPSLRDCPEVPDLVLVCVPALLVGDVVDQAGELGVAAVCVISAGFAEVDEAGRARQDELLARARSHGLRLIGPNCMGLLNGAADVRMNATFSTRFPRPGRVSMSSQSGALGLAVLQHVEALELGIATFVSVGNKADLSGNDLLRYWEDDPDTDVILMYLESFGNPRKFSRIARRVSRQKPIVAVKSGRSTSGVRAASSHTAAIGAGDVAVDALFRQAGVIRTDTLEELFDVATLLTGQGLPRGRKVAILSNAGGPAILAADALEAHGLEVPHLSDRTMQQLRTFLSPDAAVGNPVDMIASATAQAYGEALRVLGNADEVDLVLVVHIPTGITPSDEIAVAIAEARADLPADVPVIAVVMTPSGAPAALAAAGIPSFAFPEAAARAMGRVATYARWRRRPLGTVVEPPGIDRERARARVDALLAAAADRAATDSDRGSGPSRTGDADGGVWLDAEAAADVLDAYGIALARSVVVATPQEAAAAYAELGGTVAVKLASAVHKVDIGGVRLGLAGADQVADAVATMRQSLTDQGLARHAERFLVQEQITGGIEMIVGVTHDPSFGPIVLTGAGGTNVELLGDVGVRITPLTDTDVDEMLDGLRMSPLLRGYRGAPPADEPALRDLLHRINALVEDLPEVVDLDLNPVFVRGEGQGVSAVDVRMRLRRAA